MHNGDSTFAVYSIDILGEELPTYLVTLADMDNDGYVDLVIGNDMNNDGYVDLVICNDTWPGIFLVMMNNGDGTFADPPITISCGDLLHPIESDKKVEYSNWLILIDACTMFGITPPSIGITHSPKNNQSNSRIRRNESGNSRVTHKYT